MFGLNIEPTLTCLTGLKLQTLGFSWYLYFRPDISCSTLPSIFLQFFDPFRKFLIKKIIFPQAGINDGIYFFHNFPEQIVRIFFPVPYDMVMPDIGDEYLFVYFYDPVTKEIKVMLFAVNGPISFPLILILFPKYPGADRASIDR
jgi:hypothetical protein